MNMNDKRPCGGCDKPNCRICWLFNNDPRYKEHWSFAKPMPVYLINLKRRPDRLASSLAQFKNTRLQPIVFEAIDGSSLPLPPEWNEFGKGSLGCSLSHRALLQKIMSDGLADVGVMVFEDDVILEADFQDRLDTFLKNVPQDWDACFLGAQTLQDSHTTHVPHVLRVQSACRTHGYMIRGDYLRFMWRTWNMTPGHIDNTWATMQKNWRVYSPSKWLCYQGNSHSDITGRDHGDRKWAIKRVVKGEPCRTCNKGEKRDLGLGQRLEPRAVPRVLRNVRNVDNTNPQEPNKPHTQDK